MQENNKQVSELRKSNKFEGFDRQGTILSFYNPYFVTLLNYTSMQSSTPNYMNLAERIVAPCPRFFKKLSTIGLILGGVALPAVITTITRYLATASAVAVVVSQYMVIDRLI
jgi:hypothetical protein